MQKYLLLPALASMTALACGSAPREESAGRTASAIINGAASDSSQDAVVLLHYADSFESFECSGSLLAPNLVLTARHCVSKTSDVPFTCTVQGVGSAGGDTQGDFTASKIYVITGAKRPADPSAAGQYAAIGAKIIDDGAKNLCDHDIALLLLDRAIPNAQILPVRVDAPAQATEPFTAIGWGVTTTTTEPQTRQQRAGIAVRTVGPAVDKGTDAQVPDREFVVGEGTCEGDSGGPALSATTGAVFGVVSRGGNGSTANPSNPASSCVDGVNYYSMTSGYKQLLTDAYAAAGQDPWFEGGPDPRLAKFGETCAGPDACRSNMCLTDDKGAFTTCSQACDDGNPCPDGYKCKAIPAGGGECFVPPPPTVTTTKSGCSATGGAPSDALLLAVGAIAGAWRRRRRVTRAVP